MAKVYVGNLSWGTTDDILAQTFGQFGQLTDYIVMKDRETGRSRGFGFVTYQTQQEADAAITGLNDQELDGRRIRVNMANSRPAGGGGYGGGYGGGAGYGGATGGAGYGAGYPQQGGYGGGYGGAGYGGMQQPGYGAQGGFGQQGSFGQQGGYNAQGGYGGAAGSYGQPAGGYGGAPQQQGGFGGGY